MATADNRIVRVHPPVNPGIVLLLSFMTVSIFLVHPLCLSLSIIISIWKWGLLSLSFPSTLLGCTYRSQNHCSSVNLRRYYLILPHLRATRQSTLLTLKKAHPKCIGFYYQYLRTTLGRFYFSKNVKNTFIKQLPDKLDNFKISSYSLKPSIYYSIYKIIYRYPFWLLKMFG